MKKKKKGTGRLGPGKIGLSWGIGTPSGSTPGKISRAKRIGYDRVEWRFLRRAMNQMGFSQRWINRVMNCVESVGFSVLVNGIPQKEFRASRGLRQGHPLSPYMFLICSEDLFGSLENGRISKPHLWY